MERNIAQENAHLITRLGLTQELGRIARNIQQFINGLLQTMGDQNSANTVGGSGKDFTGLIKTMNINAFEKIGFVSVLSATTIWIIDRWEKFTGQKAIKL